MSLTKVQLYDLAVLSEGVLLGRGDGSGDGEIQEITLGTGLALSGTTLSVTVTGGNAFGTIAVSGQSDVIADTPSDTLTLVAGSNVTITTNAGADSVTISASAPGTGDVTGPSVSADGEIPLFSGTTGKVLQRSALTTFISTLGTIPDSVIGVVFRGYQLELYGTGGPPNTCAIFMNEPLTANRSLFLELNDDSRILTLGADLTVSGAATISGTNTGDQTITLTGDVTGSGTGSFAATIASHAVTDAKFRQGGACTVVGRSANSTGDVADISASADGKFLVRRSGALTFDTLAAADIPASAGIPAGTVQMYAGSSIPTGWLACDGAAVSRTTFAGLFTAISTTWGAGDGSTTFNVPDLRGRAPIGVGTGSGLTARTLGATGGEETHQLTVAELPAHHHRYGFVASNTPTTGAANRDNLSAGTAQNTEDTGSGTSHNTMQPWAALNFIIKT